MRNWSIVTIAALALVTIGALIFAILAQSATNARSEELVTAKVVASQTVSSLNVALSTSEASLAEAQAQRAIASTAQARLSTQVKDLSAQLNAERRKVSSLEAVNLCDYAPASIDYSNNASVSNSLKVWLEDTWGKGKIDYARWDAVWSGSSRTSIHNLTGNYVFVFIVYFDEPKFGFKKAIYDVFYLCWLDR